MKILVMSDNHGRYDLIQKLMKYWRPQVDYIFHAGDSEFPSDDPIWDDVDGVVSGNMDFDPQYRQTLEFDTPEGKVLLAHGHRHSVNRSNDILFNIAKDRQANFVFHGHTHQLYAEYNQEVLLVNPGSLNQSRGQHPERTFAIIDTDDKEITVKFYDDNNHIVDRLTKKFIK